MPNKGLFSALFLAVATFIAGCGGSSHSSSGGGSTNPALTITSVTLPTGYVGSNYTSTTLKAAGGSGSGYTWTVSGTNSLPAGIALSSGGVIAGKPTADGTASFTVKVTDSASASATAQLSITVKLGVTISTAAALPDAYVGSAYSQTLGATGGSGTGYTWSVNSDSKLPDGLALTAAGILSGKPTSKGAASFNLTVTDSANNTATAQLSTNIKPGISFLTGPTLPSAYVGGDYAQQLIATGGSGTGYTWTLANAAPAMRTRVRAMVTSGLPSGLSLSSDGWVSGSPTASGDFAATAIVKDSASNTASLDITITIAGGITITTPSALPGGNQGDIYNLRFAASGGSGTGYRWTVTSGTTVPGSLRLSSDGALTGNLPAANSYSFGLTVTDSNQDSASATFTLTVTNALRITTAPTLPKTYVGATYQYTLDAKGGSGGYTFSVSQGSSLPPGVNLSSAGVLSGKPTSAGTFPFSVTVKDAKNTAQGSLSLTVGAAVTITTPGTLPPATVGTAYTQTLVATGGSGSGYIWTLTSGGPSLSAVGLAFSNGTVSGTPTAVGLATFSVSVVDSSFTYGTGTFTVAVNNAGAVFPVNGQISLGNMCGPVSVPAVKLTINTNPVQTATSGSDGTYSFAAVPPGSYTITPSITGANSIFYPASLPVTVNNAALTGQNFTASLAYRVSGTVNYSGPERGQIYIWLVNKNCGGNPLGTSVAAPIDFTIEGVPPGSYMLGAGIDSLGFGYPNDVDARGTASPDVTVGDADVTGQSITMIDPFQSAPPTGTPIIIAVVGNANGAVINFKPIIGPNPLFGMIELPTAYVVQWSTDPTFAQVYGSQTFPAGGSNGSGVLILNDSRLVSGNTYYFRMLGTNTFGTGTWSDIYSADHVNPTGITISDPAGNPVSGTVDFSATPTGPLYVGAYNLNTGAVYATRIASPVSPQPFTVNVPSGQLTYFLFAVLDQNNDGMIDPGDVSNTRTESFTPITIDAPLPDQYLDLNTPWSKGVVTTQNVLSLQEDNSTVENYRLYFQVREGNKLPVNVRLMDGPHVLHPVSLGKCIDCGNNQYQYDVSTLSDLPAVGDVYHLAINYSDDTSETLTVPVSGMLNAFATNLTPSGVGAGTAAPTFTWTYPANPGNYTYQFWLADQQGQTIWQLPGNGSNSNAFAYTDLPFDAQTNSGSLPWTTDSGNHPASLGSGHYRWNLQVIDPNGNSTSTSVYFTVP